MAKDDYHVIVYQILAYLYQCLKKGERVEQKNLEYNCKYFQINKSYWTYILYHMQESGLIKGILFVDKTLTAWKCHIRHNWMLAE